MASAQQRRELPAEECEDWLVTYADAITLLMAFFVMLLSFSKIDMPTYEQVAAGIRNDIGRSETVSPTQLLKIDVQDVVYSMQADEVIGVGTDDRGVVLELASSAFYRPGSADILDQAKPVLQKIAQAVNAPRYQTYNIEVEGHTDDEPISTVVFPSNWELSGARAARVVRTFAEQRLDPQRMKAAGLADTRPKAPNRDAQGRPIRENQAQNRRVLVRIYPMSLDERKQAMRRAELQEIIEGQPGAPPRPLVGPPPAATGR